MTKKKQPNYIYKDNPRCLTCARYRPAKHYFTAHGHEVNIGESCIILENPTNCMNYKPSEEQKLKNAILEAETPLQRAFRELLLAAYQHKM